MDGRVFGGPAIGSGGVEVALTSMQARLIGILLVHGNHAVQLSTLIDEAWSGLPPDRAEVALRMQIARIRKRLIAVVGDAGALVTEHHAYRLAIAGDRLDVNRFEVAVDSAERAREQHRDGDALCLFEKALHIACGEPLGEFVDERWASGVAQHWRDRRLTVEDARFELLISTEKLSQAADELAEATASTPYRERRWALRMLALYRSGRQADALRAYHSARTALVEEVGVEPGGELRSLEAAILRQDPCLSARSRPTPIGDTPSRQVLLAMQENELKVALERDASSLEQSVERGVSRPLSEHGSRGWSEPARSR